MAKKIELFQHYLCTHEENDPHNLRLLIEDRYNIQKQTAMTHKEALKFNKDTIALIIEHLNPLDEIHSKFINLLKTDSKEALDLLRLFVRRLTTYRTNPLSFKISAQYDQLILAYYKKPELVLIPKEVPIIENFDPEDEAMHVAINGN